MTAGHVRRDGAILVNLELLPKPSTASISRALKTDEVGHGGGGRGVGASKKLAGTRMGRTMDGRKQITGSAGVWGTDWRMDCAQSIKSLWGPFFEVFEAIQISRRD
jgi:hypothetical protein